MGFIYYNIVTQNSNILIVKGPHYSLLVDISYLDMKFFKKNLI